MLGLRTWAQVSGFTCLHIWDQKECLTLEYLASNFRKIKPCMALHVCFRVSKTWVLAERQKVQPPGVSWKQAFELGADGASPLASLEKKSFWIGDERPLKSLESKPLFREQTLPWRPLKARLWIGDGRGPPWRPLKARLWIAGADTFESARGRTHPWRLSKQAFESGRDAPPPFAYLKSKPLNWRRFL